MPNAKPVLMSEVELEELATRAQRAIDDPKTPMLAPPQLVAQLVAGYREHRDQGTQAIMESVESGDVINDIAERLDFLRAALALIAKGGTVAELRAEAKQAIRTDNDCDADMRAEFGYGLEKLGRYVHKPVPRASEPRNGEHRRDVLGNVWKVSRTPDADGEDDGEFVDLELVEAAGAVRSDDLMSVSERIAKRARRSRRAS